MSVSVVFSGGFTGSTLAPNGFDLLVSRAEHTGTVVMVVIAARNN
ncbi:MAG: hypothetical protein QMB08_09015 [Acidimicrobiales bacterium]